MTDTDGMTETDRAEARAAEPRPVTNPLIRYGWWPVRNLWRALTSMRTALALLFLLALAAVPGALLPQRELNAQKTDKYIADHGWIGRTMDHLQMFEVFKSVWFTAIYALLFISLVGCLTPRMWEQAKILRAKPVPAPRNFTRLPRNIDTTATAASADDLASTISGRLRGWRKTTRVVERDGVRSVEISAEKGFLREVGNLVFHFALLCLLLSIAVGKLWGYEGTRILVGGEGQGLCNTSVAVYDSFRAGSMVNGTNLAPFCINLDKVQTTYEPTGEAKDFTSKVDYQTGGNVGSDQWKTDTIRVNHPLRIVGDRIYMLGHGYAPTFTVTFPNGQSRTQTVAFEPSNMLTMLSEGVARFDTPAGMYTDDDQRRQNQIAINGIFAPTAVFSGDRGGLLQSSFPRADKPAVAIDIYQGDTGLDTGRPQSVFMLDDRMINDGRLRKQARVNLSIGQSTTIPNGTQVRFDGYQEWASLQVSHDPAQDYVLISAIALLLGLVTSLMIKRRRVFVRLTPVAGSDGTIRAEVAGLARTDQAGWGERFNEFAADLVNGRDAAGGNKRD